MVGVQFWSTVIIVFLVTYKYYLCVCDYLLLLFVISLASPSSASSLTLIYVSLLRLTLRIINRSTMSTEVVIVSGMAPMLEN